MRSHELALLGAVMVAVLGVPGCKTAGAADSCREERKLTTSHLETFDDLDYNVFSGQKWSELHRSHTQDVLVHWPDGHTTKGLEKHIDDLKGMFVWAPDTRVRSHPVKVAQGDWTAVIGTMEGTFTRPMPMPGGKTAAPTGKGYKLQMSTFSHWTKEGPMDEEYLFWDSQELMKQIGLAK